MFDAKPDASAVVAVVARYELRLLTHDHSPWDGGGVAIGFHHGQVSGVRRFRPLAKVA